VFVIDKVLSLVKPTLYKLKDLLGDSIPGYYYGAQLIKTTKPKDSDYQLVEKVLKQKTIKGETFYLVKFLFYPEKFNLWLPARNIKKGK